MSSLLRIDFHPTTRENEERVSGEHGCRRCGYRVYDAEKLMAAGRVRNAIRTGALKKLNPDSSAQLQRTGGRIFSLVRVCACFELCTLSVIGYDT
jgi:hypothetical protein